MIVPSKISDVNIDSEIRKKRVSVGIDLGTTNSLIATVQSGKVKILPDFKGRYLLPSVVRYQKNTYIVGHDAYNLASKDPANTINSVKRLLGRSLKDIQKYYPYLPYKLKSSKNNLPMIETEAGLVNPIQVSSDILKTLLIRANETLQNKIDGAVITVPAYFDDSQRQGVKDAANLAGLHVLRLLNEPTAAAIAYGLNSNNRGIIAIYDLGGGTFDISILQLSRGVFEVIATRGDSMLGGDDFDNLLADYIRKLAKINDCSDIRLQREILNTSILAKIELSNSKKVFIEVPGWNGEISRKQFNYLISPLVNRTILSCYHALKDAGVKPKDILEVVMVGGSTRIPLVRKLVRKFFHRQPLISIDPDKVVAIGAAIQANLLIGNASDQEILLLDVISISLGIETIGGLVEIIIPHNSTIPVEKTKEFTTLKDNQTAMFIHVIQGESKLVKDCRSLARFSLLGIPALPAGSARISVTFQVDADGILNVTAVEKSTGIKTSITVHPSYGLTKNEVSIMTQNSIKFAEKDTCKVLN